MTTAINIGRVPIESGHPQTQAPRPKQEWWVGDKKLTILPQGARPARLYFHTDDGRQFRYHHDDDNLALLRQNGKERREERRPPTELHADPKWAGKLAERRTRMTTQKTIRTWRWATLELRPTLVAYYGATTTTETKMAGWGVSVVHTTTITYALHKTDETPNAFPLTPETFQTIYRNAKNGTHPNTRLHPTLTATADDEQRRQGRATADLTHHLQRGTKWVIAPYTTTTTSYADGRPSKTTTKELDGGRAELPYSPPLLMLTGFSTRAKAEAIPQITTTNTLDFDYKFRPLYANLEATRRLRAELKRELCEAVLHPDRITRMAEKFDLAPDEYMEAI